MKNSLKTTFITTLFHLPVLFWFYIIISVHRTGEMNLAEPMNIGTGLSMIMAIVVLSYTTTKINKSPALVYWLFPLLVLVSMIFDNSWVADIGLLLAYIGFMLYPSKEDEKVQYDEPTSMPLWLRLKKERYHDVDFSNNSVDEILKLTDDEFDEFLHTCDEGMLFTYLSILSDSELKRFYDYLKNSAGYIAKTDFMAYKVDLQASLAGKRIGDIDRAKVTLEMPLVINFSKSIHHKINSFIASRDANYFTKDKDSRSYKFETAFTNILWDNMANIPTHFEEVLDALQKDYDESNNEHQEFMGHIAKRFGHLIVVLDLLVGLTQDERKSSLSWFVENAMSDIKLDGFEIYKDDPLNFHMTNMFMAMVEKNDNAYLSSLISVVQTLFEYYPVNRPACEYAMAEMMKIVATKKIDDVDVANRFLTFFQTLPRFYDELTFARIIELKDVIGYHIANYKPQDNAIFDDEKAKNKTILLNYLVDVEDLYYQNRKG